MAWFSYGKKSSDSSSDMSERALPLESAESMRSRAKRRLLGSVILVTTAVIGFPLLFDTQPRPALIDVPIEIPDKSKVKPLTTTPAPSSTPAASVEPKLEPKVEDKASLGSKEEIVSASPSVKPAAPSAAVIAAGAATAVVAGAVIAQKAEKSSTKPAEMPVKPAGAAPKIEAKESKPAPEKITPVEKPAKPEKAQKAEKPDVQSTEAERAKAILEGKANPAVEKSAPASSSGERFIVQFGSFADGAKAQEARRRVERTGLKTYAQEANTADGKRIRARVGPFTSRAEAEKAASKIKALDLPAAILTL